jgi:hypothetical protein
MRSDVRDAAKTGAFHFMRAFSFASQQMTPDNIGLFCMFGKIGMPRTVKR